MDDMILAVQIIVGTLCLLFGFKFQKGILAIIGCGIGYLLGSYIVDAFTITGGLDIVLKAGLSLIVGIFSFTLFEYLLAIIVGIELFIVIGDMFNSVWYGYLIGVVVGVVGGLLTKLFYKFGIILATSLIGSYIITGCIMSYFNVPYAIIFIILFVIGFVFQESTNKA